uniref:RING-type domain-containing protein n=1 Tax=Denticeps clupeoides TaxID=299321 RepID=A0AAY4BPN5_9TELE
MTDIWRSLPLSRTTVVTMTFALPDLLYHQLTEIEHFYLWIPTGNHAGLLTGQDHEHPGFVIPVTSDLLQRQHESEIHRLSTRSFDPAGNSRQSDCRICLCEYTAGEELRVLPCLHDFHAECVGRWLQQSPSCPICRADVF